MAKKVQLISFEIEKVEKANHFIEKEIYDLRNNFDVHPSKLVISMPLYFQELLERYNQEMIANFSVNLSVNKKFMGIRITENYLNEIAVYDVNCMFDNNETLKIFKL